ncbi:MAG TPA: 50S ribosomal protein L7ae [Firmicutes bacterium]|jgi:ribosomal protein L7Ae-like RNA K-turn-binding protein|nr:50S ribosomal protein L7ae [Bacillota bacterium]
MNKLITILGFAQKAGKIASGETATEQVINQRKACLVLVALDASAGTSAKFMELCLKNNIPVFNAGLKLELGNAIGRSPRSCIAFLDNGFARAAIEALKATTEV